MAGMSTACRRRWRVDESRPHVRATDSLVSATAVILAATAIGIHIDGFLVICSQQGNVFQTLVREHEKSTRIMVVIEGPAPLSEFYLLF
jgi:hypothetical protein